MTSQTKISGVDLTLSPNTFTKSGFSFTGWNTLANGTGTAYADGATYTANAAVTLYAQWTSAITYTVSFNANTGTGTMAAQTKTHDVNLTLSPNTFTKTGNSFAGWNTLANGEAANGLCEWRDGRADEDSRRESDFVVEYLHQNRTQLRWLEHAG